MEKDIFNFDLNFQDLNSQDLNLNLLDTKPSLSFEPQVDNKVSGSLSFNLEPEKDLCDTVSDPKACALQIAEDWMKTQHKGK